MAIESRVYRFNRREVNAPEIPLGSVGDNKVRSIGFVLPEIAENQLAYIKFDFTAMPVKQPLIKNGDAWAFEVGGGLMAEAGIFGAQVEVFNSDDALIWNSEIFTVCVSESLDANEEIEPVMLPELLAAEAALQEANARTEEILSAVDAENERVQAENERKAYIEQLKSDVDAGRFDGEQGKPGEPGEAGEQGEPGKSAYEFAVEGGYTGTEEEFAHKLAEGIGPEGPQGENGESAYEIAVRVDGFTGTEQEWLDSLQGPPGPEGKQGLVGSPGADGRPGIDGKDGKDGTSITIESVLLYDGDGGYNEVTFSDGSVLRVKNGDTGKTGAIGPVGPSGPSGIPGRDGESGVYVGADEPSGDENVWINPDGEADIPITSLPIASPETLGGVKVGNGLEIAEDGTLSASAEGVYELIETIAVNYKLLAEKPDDWDTNWAAYYSASLQAGVKALSGKTAWMPYTYYADDGNDGLQSVIRTESPKGEPYRFKHIAVKMRMEKGSGGSAVNCWIQTNESVLGQCGTINALISAQNIQWGAVLADIQNGYARVIATSATGNYYGSNIVNTAAVPRIIHQLPYIGCVNITPVATFPIPKGSVIEIWGVRA